MKQRVSLTSVVDLLCSPASPGSGEQVKAAASGGGIDGLILSILIFGDF